LDVKFRFFFSLDLVICLISVILLFFLRRNQGVIYNILVWLCLLVGVGLQSCFYFMEAYARKACPENVNRLLSSLQMKKKHLVI